MPKEKVICPTRYTRTGRLYRGKTAKQWAEELGLNRHTIDWRDSQRQAVAINKNMATYDSTDVPQSIPDFGGGNATSTITDSIGSLSDQNISVTLDITHTYDSDLTATLTSPSSTTIILFDGVGDAGHDFTGTTFSDTASTAIESGTAPFSDTYLPHQPFSTFFGEDGDGTWTLTITDNATGDTGTLNSWSITTATITAFGYTGGGTIAFGGSALAVSTAHYKYRGSGNVVLNGAATLSGGVNCIGSGRIRFTGRADRSLSYTYQFVSVVDHIHAIPLGDVVLGSPGSYLPIGLGYIEFNSQTVCKLAQICGKRGNQLQRPSGLQTHLPICWAQTLPLPAKRPAITPNITRGLDHFTLPLRPVASRLTFSLPAW